MTDTFLQVTGFDPLTVTSTTPGPAGPQGPQGPPGSGGGGGGGVVATVVPGTNIGVDATDPANPIVSTTAITQAQGDARYDQIAGVLSGGSAATRIKQIQVRRASAATWTSVNPVLADGEGGLESDTGRIKYGDGGTAWTGLAYQESRLDLPYYAPKSLKHRWDAFNASYNVKPDNTHSIKTKLAGAAANTGGFHLAILADSTMADYNGATYSYKQGIPYRLGIALAKLTGNPYPTTGVTLAGAVYSVVTQDRWTLTGTWTASNCLISSTVGTATWVTPDQCTSVEIYFSNLSAAGATMTVDGTPVTVPTPTGAGTVNKVTASGLTNGYHTVVLTVPALFVLLAQRCWNPSLNQIHIHNLSLGGARANSGVNQQNWSNTTTSGNVGLGYLVPLIMAAAGITPDAVLICIGNNDAFSGVASTTIATGLQNMVNYYSSTSPTLLLHPMMVPGTNQTIFDGLCAAFFTQADTTNCPSFDWNYYSNFLASYVADGQAGADGIHPTFTHQNLVATWLAQQICQRAFNGESGPYWPGIVGNPAGRYKVIEAAGVYPPRPNVQPGACDFEGPDQPADWLDGDSWDDLP